MATVYDYAKFFIKKGADSTPNTFDGNMKLQKLLVMANLINIALHGSTLFNDEILAFKNGCVVEKVRLRYKNDYYDFKHDSDSFQPDFTQQEYEVLNLTLSIFGGANAKELSKVNHEFTFWSEAYENGWDHERDYHDKAKSVVNIFAHPADIEKMREIIEAHKQANAERVAVEQINGVKFLYDGFEITDKMLEKLEAFSETAEDTAYSVYYDNGELVIY